MFVVSFSCEVIPSPIFLAWLLLVYRKATEFYMFVLFMCILGIKFRPAGLKASTSACCHLTAHTCFLPPANKYLIKGQLIFTQAWDLVFVSETLFFLSHYSTFLPLRQDSSIMYPWLSENSLRRPGWPWTHRDPPDFALQLLGLKVGTTTPGLNSISLKDTYYRAPM